MPTPPPPQHASPQSRPLALVTGASSGIGRAIAADLAGRGHDLLVASDEESIHAVAGDLAVAGGEVRAVRCDLTSSEEVERLHEELLAWRRPLDVLVLNAGVAVSGAVTATPLQDELRLVDLNCRSVVHLAKLVLPGMVEQDRGRVLVTSSVASAAPNPYQASYGASKAFLRSWAAAVRHELSGSKVTVTTLMPGPTDTAIFRGGPIETTPIANGHLDRPEDVARDAVDATLAGRAGVVTGPLLNRAQVVAASFIPDRVLASVAALVTRPRT